MISKMNILIIGSGGREHAICKALTNCTIYNYGSHVNPGIRDLIGEDNMVIGLLNDVTNIITCAKQFSINMAVVGPEGPLENGLADAFEDEGIPCIGPKKTLARIETSKIFARELMIRAGLEIYCPKFKYFKPGDKSFKDYIQIYSVIKADGLHGGKGVKIYGEDLSSKSQAIIHCCNIQEDGESILLEEKMIGKEFSFMTFTDGNTSCHTIPVMDFKRLNPEKGSPMTGGMGSVTGASGKLPFLTDKDINTCKFINEKIIDALVVESGEYYKGILYGSFMKLSNGHIKVVEFNCRFGDSECINVLALMKNNLLDVFTAIRDNVLDGITLEFNNQASVFKYAVPLGYPNYPKGKLHKAYANMIGLNDQFYFASIVYNHDFRIYELLGSRSFGYLSLAANIKQASIDVNKKFKYSIMPSSKMYFREDIGLKNITYKSAGVNVEEGNKVVKKIQEHVESTFNENVISKFGDFCGIYKMNNTLLASTTDGVGTKSVLVLNHYPPSIGFKMLGKDLVNHCVNDILVKGAKPLFFLDYFASNKIKSDYVEYFVSGVAEACRIAGCVLAGGETAEMPDVYQDGKYDLVGTMVGFIEDRIIDGQRDISSGDVIIGLNSSGPHTNGYSLIRKLVDEYPTELIKKMDDLCATHKSYLHEYDQIVKAGIKILGMCHITGGGFDDNISRILPSGLKIIWNQFEMTSVFNLLQEVGGLSDKTMKDVFNCGYGMLIFIPLEDLYKLDSCSFKYTVMGSVTNQATPDRILQ